MRKISRLALAGLAVLMLAPVAGRASIVPETQLCADPAFDGQVLEDLQPTDLDLIGCSIREDDDSFYIKWTVLDIEDTLGATPNVSSWYFNFSLDDAGSNPPKSYQFVVEATRGGGNGSLSTDCVVENNVTSCNSAAGSATTVTVNRSANTIEARLKRNLFKGADGAKIATDGTILAEDSNVYSGIAACVTTLGASSGNTCDVADITETEDGTYTFGG